MKIEIERSAYKPWGIDGVLKINGRRVCDTVEHPWRHKPLGAYEIELETHPFRHGDGPMKSVDGEIIVGDMVLSGLVKHSAEKYGKLYQRLKKAWQRGSEVKLIIRDQ